MSFYSVPDRSAFCRSQGCERFNSIIEKKLTIFQSPFYWLTEVTTNEPSWMVGIRTYQHGGTCVRVTPQKSSGQKYHFHLKQNGFQLNG